MDAREKPPAWRLSRVIVAIGMGVDATVVGAVDSGLASDPFTFAPELMPLT